MKMQSTVTITITLILDWQEDVYVVTCKELPELLTDGRTIEEVIDNAADALVATLEIYQEMQRQLPDGIIKEEKEVITSPKIRTITPEYEPDLWLQFMMLPPESQSSLYAL